MPGHIYEEGATCPHLVKPVGNFFLKRGSWGYTTLHHVPWGPGVRETSQEVGIRLARIHILTLLLISCVTLGKLISFPSFLQCDREQYLLHNNSMRQLLEQGLVYRELLSLGSLLWR